MIENEVVTIPDKARFVGDLPKLYNKLRSLRSKRFIAQLWEYKFCVGAVAALNIDIQGLLDFLYWLSCPFNVLYTFVINLLKCAAIEFVKGTVDGYFYIVSLSFQCHVFDFFCHRVFLLHCLTVGVVRAEELFENSEGISTVDIACYLVRSFGDSVMKSSITVSVKKSSVARVTEDFVSFANFTEIGHVFGHLRLVISNRMILESQLAVGLSDFFFRGVRFDTKSFVVLKVAHFKLFIIIKHQR